MTKNLVLNLSVNASDFGNPYVQRGLTKEQVLEWCTETDTLALYAALVTFCLLFLSIIWYGPVRQRGGLRQRLWERYGHTTWYPRLAPLIDGLLLPLAGITASLTLAALWWFT